MITRRSLHLALAALSLAATPLLAADLPVGPGQTYTTIQAAVDAAAAAGDTITVDPGTYTEQVTVVAKDLTLRGAGAGSTVIAAPISLVSLYNDGGDHFAVVGLQDATVHLADLTVDGQGAGNLHEPFFGVLLRNAGGSLDRVAITGVRNEPLDGVAHGVGLAGRNDDTVSRSLDVTGAVIDDCQLAAIDLRTAADTPLTVALTGGLITGADADAIGVHLEGCGGAVDGLVVTDCQTGLDLLGSPVAVTGCTVTGDLALDDVTGSAGLVVANLEGHADLDLSATGNTFTGLEAAIVLRDTGAVVGAWLGATCTGNTFNTCGAGLDSDLALQTLAEDCWWGALDGPGGDGPGSGVALLGSADVDPWRTDVLNLVCSPAALDLSEAMPAGSVVFSYTGGASGRIYGFSIDVTWDPAVASATSADFARPASGPFAAADYFITQDIAAGHVRVDLALGSVTAGAYTGDLFQAAFALEPTALDEATTAITPAVLNIRDNLNQPLAGLVPDPGGLTVDSTPVIADVLVTDTTLGSSDWTGDGHDLTVTATVVESSLDSLRCDLAAFGGPVLELADATVDGDTYTWTFSGTSGTGDGDVSALVTAQDTQAAAAGLADLITADNTPPAALTGLTVAPGHQKIHLGWSAPEADSGSPLVGVEFRYAAWGGYPAYAGPLPDAPADLASGSDPALGVIADTAVDWLVAPRDVYVLAGFVRDYVGNVSPLGDSGAATNYWLGDHNGDGVVDVFDDLTALGDSYGKATGEPGYDPVCDVGPTLDWSPRGIPNPEADGYQVQFEDLMVTALNHDEVGPDQKRLPGEAPRLRWQQTEPRTWVLTLDEPCPDLRGLNLRGALPAGVTCQVTAGALLGQQSAPVFVRNIASRGLDAGVAAMGPGARIEGAGELLRVVTSRPLAALPAELQARDGANHELLTDTTGAELPSAHGLAQNAPNPFNPRTTIEFALPTAEAVRLAVYSVDGRLVKILVDEVRPAGRHAVSWDGRDDAGRAVAAGAYFYAVQAGNFRQVRKMTLLK
ncbi:MAG: FlgD immunoglobulin-like domain containing protein [Candidatus Krumholzibacteriia bacterium]